MNAPELKEAITEPKKFEHDYPPFCYRVSYCYKTIDVETRETILSGTQTARIDVPPYVDRDRGELEIHLQHRCALKEYYDARRYALRDVAFKEFLGGREFTVQCELISYVELKTMKEVILVTT